jgi:hypothetical protein
MADDGQAAPDLASDDIGDDAVTAPDAAPEEPLSETGADATTAQSEDDASGDNNMPQVPADVTDPVRKIGITGGTDAENPGGPNAVPDVRPDGGNSQNQAIPLPR